MPLHGDDHDHHPHAHPRPADTAIHAARVHEPPPDVNGDLVEWTSLVYSIAQPVFGAGNWQGPDDLSGAWNIAWDETYLYLAIAVRDDVFVQLASGANRFQGDGVEILLDADLVGDAGPRVLNGDDFQLGLSPGNFAAPEAYLWFPVTTQRLKPRLHKKRSLPPQAGFESP